MLNNFTMVLTDAIGKGWYDSMVAGGETLESGGETVNYNPLNQLIDIGDNALIVIGTLVLILIMIGLFVKWASSATSPNNAEAKEEFKDSVLLTIIQVGIIIFILGGVFTSISAAIFNNGGL